MKLHKIINTVLILCLGWLVACAPITDNVEIVNAFNPNDIQLSVTQTPVGSNVLTLNMNTPGVTGFWRNAIAGTIGFGDQAKVNFVFPGTHTFEYVVGTPFIPADGNIMNRQYIVRTIDVTIDFIEPGTLPSQIEYLTGGSSKTWVIDPEGWRGFIAGDPGRPIGAPWDGSFVGWGMSSHSNWGGPRIYSWFEGNPWDFWWRPAPPADVLNGRMTFRLDPDGFNFTSQASPTDPVIGNTIWAANSDWTQLTLTGDANIVGQAGPPAPTSPVAGNRQAYYIVELSEDRLVLFRRWVDGDDGNAWTWVLRPE